MNDKEREQLVDLMEQFLTSNDPSSLLHLVSVACSLQVGSCKQSDKRNIGYWMKVTHEVKKFGKEIDGLNS